MEQVKIVVAQDGVDRTFKTLDYKHTGDGNWAADIGDGFEQYASFEVVPDDDSAFETQSRTVAQLLRKEFDDSFGGNPEKLKF